MANANVINGTQYSQLATYYGNLVNTLTAATVYLYDAVLLIADLQEINPEVDMLIPFNSVYVQQAASLTSSTGLLAAVTALNNHVITRARTAGGAIYTDINDWFADQDLAGYTVSFPQSWANLSLQTGTNVQEFGAN